MPIKKLNELKKGIKATSKYALSHHLKKEEYKCYRMKFFNNLLICARCLGIYIGIIIGFLIHKIPIEYTKLSYFVVTIFPIFTVLEWSISTFSKYKSNNINRTISGLTLGIAYSFGIILFYNFPNFYIILIGTIYILTAVFLLYKKNKKIKI